MSSSSLKIVPRFSTDRGNADHGWLKTFHTFSFASYVLTVLPFIIYTLILHPRYHGKGHDKFGPLRVINEDRVESNTGFGTHSHREFEIFSYIIGGELQQ
jgi:quercetin 2,3-dioxygenase